MANSHSSFVIPNHESSRFTDKFHRCLGHVRTANAKRGTDYEPYGVCTASIGYAGSYTPSHRRGARTPAGRARRMRESNLSESRARMTERFGVTTFEPGAIGYSPSKQKWYGWSHRAVAGFGVGSRVRPGDVIEKDFTPGFEARSLADAKRMAVAFAKSVS